MKTKLRLSPRFLATSVASLLPVLAVLPGARAAVTKADNTTLLNDVNSYVGLALPVSTDVLIVNNTLTAARTANLGGSLSILGIQVVNPTGAFTIGATGGSTLTIGASGVDLTTATQNLTNNAATLLSGVQTWNVQTARTYQQGGSLDLAGNALTLTGVGTKNLNGSVLFNGANLVANAGTANLAGAVDLSANTLTYTTSATGSLGSQVTGTATTVSGAPGSAIVVSGAASLTSYAALNFSGGITMSSTGVLTLNGAGSYNGGVNLSAGTLTLNHGAALGVGTLTITGGNIQANGAGALLVTTDNAQAWNGNFGFLLSNPVNLGAGAVTMNASRTITIGSSGRYTIGGVIGDGGSNFSLTTAGAGGGILNLTGLNTYGGGTTISTNNVILGISSSAAIGSGALTIANTGSIGNFSSGPVTLSTNNVQAWNSNFTFTGARDLNMGTGAVTMNAARVITVTSTASPGGVYVAGSSLAPVLTVAGNIDDTAGGFALTAGVANVSLTGILNLAGTNTYSGGTLAQGAVLRFASAAAIPATGTIRINGGALSISGAFPTLNDVLIHPQLSAVAGERAGALALTTDSSENFIAPAVGTLSVGAQVGTAVTYTGTITPAANNYRVGGGGGQLIVPTVNAFTGARQLTIGNGGSGMVVITGTNDYTGQTNIDGGVEVSRLGNIGGGNTPLGAAANAAGGLLNFSSAQSLDILRYVGTGESTDRTFRMGAGYNGGQMRIDASGSGALTLANPVIPFSNLATGTRAVTLLGTNTAANTFAGALADNGGGGNTSIVSFAKNQRGNWTLTGANTFTGNIIINGGTLGLDYATTSTVVAATNNLTLNGGTLNVIGNAAGSTAQSLGILTAGTNTGQSTIRVNNNGGTGTTLTLNGTFVRNAGSYVNFDLTQGGTIASTQALTNGLLTPSGLGFTVTDLDGLGNLRADYPTVTGGNIVRLAATTPLGTNGGSTATNYVLTNPTLTNNGFTSANSIRVDTSANAIVWDRGASNTIQFGGGGGLLVTGVNDFTLKSSGGANSRWSVSDNATLVFHQYGTSANGFKVQNTTLTAGTGGIVKTGPGLMDVQSNQIHIGDTSIFGGVWRSSAAQGYGGGQVVLATGGILELGFADFTGPLGRIGAGAVRWLYGDGGFSAFGADRVVNLGGASAPVVWGFDEFVASGQALLLGSSYANARVDFQNPINLGSISRVVEVGNGSAPIDARLSGIISGLGTGGLDKSGAGTLELSSTNSYSGANRILGGTLSVATLGNGGGATPLGVSSNAASNLVLAGGTLQYTGSTVASTDRLFDLVSNGGLDGSGTVPVTFTNTGANSATGTPSARTLTLTGSNTGDNTLVSDIVNSGIGANITGLTKSGAGKWVLSGAKSYSGVTAITNGVLSISTSTNLGDGSATNSLALNGGTLLDTGTGVNLGVNRSVVLGAGGGTVEVAAMKDLTIPGTVSGTGNVLNKTGTGTLTLGGAQNYGALNANDGITNVNGSFTAGTATITANDTTNINAAQNLAALVVADGVTVTFGPGPGMAPLAPSFGAPVLVPEPGAMSLLLIGSLGFLARRRRS